MITEFVGATTPMGSDSSTAIENSLVSDAPEVHQNINFLCRDH